MFKTMIAAAALLALAGAASQAQRYDDPFDTTIPKRLYQQQQPSYTVNGPNGVTFVNPNGAGGYTANGPNGVTFYTPNGMGGWTASGSDGVTFINPQ